MANQSVILEALAEKEARGRLLQLLEGFLVERSTCVRFQDHLSTSQRHTLGTPQGSCLSPFLLNVLIEKLSTVFYGQGVMPLCYADDLALVTPRRHHQTSVPRALELLLQRFSFLDLKINPGKSRFMPSAPRATAPTR